MPYEVHVRKSYKRMPHDSYLYLSIQLAKCMMSNFCGPVRTQKMSTLKISNYEMSTQNIPNLYVCYTNDRESKIINADKSESRRVNVNACSMDESESKSAHEINISVNKSEVKDTKYE